MTVRSLAHVSASKKPLASLWEGLDDRAAADLMASAVLRPDQARPPRRRTRRGRSRRAATVIASAGLCMRRAFAYTTL